MREWINTYDGVFFITIASLVCGAFGLSVRYCLKSRCDNVNLCFGLITIHRNVELESNEEIRKIENGINDEEERKKNNLKIIINKPTYLKQLSQYSLKAWAVIPIDSIRD